MSKSRDTIAKATFEVVATKLVQLLRMGPKYGLFHPLPLRTQTSLHEAQNVIKI